MKALIITAALLVSSLFASAQKLTATERSQWNGFVKYIEYRGYKGSKELDKANDLSTCLFAAYCIEKGLTLDYVSFVTRVQTDIADYRAKAIEQIKAGKATFDGPLDMFMVGLSKIDGKAGSKTTSYSFPAETVGIYLKDQVVATKTNDLYK